MATEPPHLIRQDYEMTGLNISTESLVEIAVLVTDSELNVIGDGVDVVIHATEGQLASMSDFVHEMHTTSGLITEIPIGISMSQAEEQILTYLQSAGTEPGKSPLAGNSMSVDRNFILRAMSPANKYPHYRTIEVFYI